MLPHCPHPDHVAATLLCVGLTLFVGVLFIGSLAALAALNIWPLQQRHMRKGGINPTPKNFIRPAPPPFRPERSR